MSTRVSGGGGRTPLEPEKAEPNPSDASEGATRSQETSPKQLREAGKTEGLSTQVFDSFQRVVPLVEKQLQAMAGKPVVGQLRFSSEQLAQLASAFAALIKGHPRAGSKQRAALFVRAMIKQKRIGRLLEQATETEIERMTEMIAEQLDGSPFFSQLVNDVFNGARKTQAG